MTTQEQHAQGAQLMQVLWESFALDLYMVERAPRAQRERKTLDAGTKLASMLHRLGFTEEQADVYLSAYIDSLRSYLEFPASERGAMQ